MSGFAVRGSSKQLTVSNDGHVTDVGRLVHQLTDLPSPLASCHVSFLPYVYICPLCAVATYLLDGEAGKLLASCFIRRF